MLGPRAVPPKAKATLHIDVRNAIYSRLIELLPLRDAAVADLTRRGLPRWLVESHGFRSLPRRGAQQTEIRNTLVREFGADALSRCPGTHDKNHRVGVITAPEVDGYFVPYRDERGRITGLQVRYLGGPRRYRTLFGTLTREMYCISGPLQQGCDLWVTEGGLKAVVAAHLRPGVVCFGVPGQGLQDDHVRVIRSLEPGRVFVALDRELNRNTDAARERWIARLLDAGLVVFDSVWEGAA